MSVVGGLGFGVCVSCKHQVTRALLWPTWQDVQSAIIFPKIASSFHHLFKACLFD